MKRGREESGKSVSPLFPRLHINDACKGGPRAPPRNKMALYEQLSVPSQRSGLSVPFPPQHSGMTRLPLPSHGEVCGYEKSPFPPYHMRSQLPAGSSGNVHSNSSNTMGINSARVSGRKSSKHATRSNASGPSQSATECNSSRQIPSQKAHSRNVSENTDHFTVPAFMRSGIVSYLKKDQNITAGTHFKLAESRKIAAIGPSSQIPSSPRSALARFRITKLSSENARKQDVAKPATSIKHIGGFVKEIAGTASTRSFSLDEDQCQEHHVQYISSRNLGRVGSSADAGIVGKVITSRAELEPEKHNLHGSDPAEPIDMGNEARCSGREVNDDNSETSILETDPCFNMSPDVVVGVIGAKHFWKARQAIVNQQRIFSVQVFELHRLIRVQKLIAALPHVLVEGNPCFESPDIPSMELPNANTATRKSTRTPKELKEKSKNGNSSQLCSEAHARKAMPPPESYPTPVSEDKHCTENSSADQVASQNQPNPWCFPPPGNQWLVPVMSPSEGLVYKPYTGPCPPPTGFMPSVYGGYTPLPSYATPTPQRHSNVHYGTTSVPYVLAVASASASASTSEQASHLFGQPSTKPKQQTRMSYNLSKPRSREASGSAWKVQSSKESDLQGSTASSPAERISERSHLPLFPTAPCNEDSNQSTPARCGDQRTQAIKVVPHNPMSASKSAARIFRSIQKERQKYC